jgi:CRP/FNR family transcriptional regulator
MPLFAELDDAALERLAARCVLRALPEGTVLFTAGEPCRGLYVVRRGRVRIYRVSPEGREQVLHVEGPGRPVAELPLFDGGTYPASAVTVEDAELLFLPRTDFEQACRDSPDIAQAIIRALGRRLRHLVHVTETLAFRDVASRLALLLAGYADRLGRPAEGGVELLLARTQEELSFEIGTARESVSRAFRQLERKGLLRRLDGSRILIPDPGRLRAAARE